MAFVVDRMHRNLFDPARGLAVQIRGGRHESTLIVTKNGKPFIDVPVQSTGRAMTDKERQEHPEIKCREVIIWRLRGMPKEIDLITEALTAYQSVVGVGCYIDGEPFDALIEVQPNSPFTYVD